jgi:hypothetical protein
LDGVVFLFGTAMAETPLISLVRWGLLVEPDGINLKKTGKTVGYLTTKQKRP